MRKPVFSLAAVILFLLVGATLSGQEGLSPIQMMSLRSVTSAHPSPDGKTIAFVRTEPRFADADEPGPAYTNLWIVPAGGGEERRLIEGTRTVRGVAWRPDGSWITFLDKRDGDEHDEIYALPMKGGEAFRVTRTKNGVSEYRWRPDGKAIAFTSSDRDSEARESARKMGFKQVVVDEGWSHVSLHLWNLKDEASKQLTTGVSVFSFEWSPDGSRLAAGIAPRPLVDDSYMNVQLHLVDPEAATFEKLVENPGKLGDYAWSPDGDRLAYVSAADRNDPHAGMLYVVNVKTREVRGLTEGFEGMVNHVEWLRSESIRCAISRGVHDSIADLEVATGKWKNVTPEGPAFDSFAVSGDGATTAVVASTSLHPSELFSFGTAWKRMTDSNPWLGDVTLGKQVVETFTARDGLKIQGMLIYPVDHRSDERYPLVIVAHGGPEAHFSNGWMTSYGNWGQMLSARGYFVWYPNYRSSTGRGVAFAKADHGDPMGREFEDHLDAIAYLDEKGLIDRARVGIGGGSYGGYTAAWAATRHTEHFAAAVSFVPFVDIRTKWYTTDIPEEFYFVHYQEKWPHQQEEFLKERSPLTYAPNCRTPLLLLGGTSDPRVHPSQPFMLYTAVKTSTETPVRYVQYPGEGHGNRSNVYRYDYAIRTMRWFDHYRKPGNRRQDAPPPAELDYEEWKSTGKKDEGDSEAD
jgi:dipeptidyl aminopeptidase/acylaminoacyl peptidase